MVQVFSHTAPADDRAAAPLLSRLRSLLTTPGRSRRIAFMLSVVWLVSVVDLALTKAALATGHFVEANPLAAMFTSHHLLLTGYKITLVVASSAVLLRLRHHRLSEAGCLVAMGAHGGLMVAWFIYARLCQWI